MYVDDVMGVCFKEDLEADLITARGICTGLLGPGSVANDKTESGVRLDMIGYTISLPDNRVRISRKNFLTALHGFISTDVTRRLYQRCPVPNYVGARGRARDLVLCRCREVGGC
jgi:hypothetical protein